MNPDKSNFSFTQIEKFVEKRLKEVRYDVSVYFGKRRDQQRDLQSIHQLNYEPHNFMASLVFLEDQDQSAPVKIYLNEENLWQFLNSSQWDSFKCLRICESSLLRILLEHLHCLTKGNKVTTFKIATFKDLKFPIGGLRSDENQMHTETTKISFTWFIREASLHMHESMNSDASSSTQSSLAEMTKSKWHGDKQVRVKKIQESHSTDLSEEKQIPRQSQKKTKRLYVKSAVQFKKGSRESPTSTAGYNISPTTGRKSPFKFKPSIEQVFMDVTFMDNRDSMSSRCRSRSSTVSPGKETQPLPTASPKEPFRLTDPNEMLILKCAETNVHPCPKSWSERKKSFRSFNSGRRNALIPELKSSVQQQPSLPRLGSCKSDDTIKTNGSSNAEKTPIPQDLNIRFSIEYMRNEKRKRQKGHVLNRTLARQLLWEKVVNLLEKKLNGKIAWPGYDGPPKRLRPSLFNAPGLEVLKDPAFQSFGNVPVLPHLTLPKGSETKRSRRQEILSQNTRKFPRDTLHNLSTEKHRSSVKKNSASTKIMLSIGKTAVPDNIKDKNRKSLVNKNGNAKDRLTSSMLLPRLRNELGNINRQAEYEVTSCQPRFSASQCNAQDSTIPRFFKPSVPEDFADRLKDALENFTFRKEQVTRNNGRPTIRTLTITRIPLIMQSTPLKHNTT